MPFSFSKVSSNRLFFPLKIMFQTQQGLTDIMQSSKAVFTSNTNKSQSFWILYWISWCSFLYVAGVSDTKQMKCYMSYSFTHIPQKNRFTNAISFQFLYVIKLKKKKKTVTASSSLAVHFCYRTGVIKNQNLRTQSVDGDLYASLPDLLQTQAGRSRGMEGREWTGEWQARFSFQSESSFQNHRYPNLSQCYQHTEVNG